MMGIKDDRLIIDYTPDVKRALSILKKFTGGKHRKEFQNKFFLTEDSDGSYVFAATDGAVMAVYRLNTTVYVPENTPNLYLDLSGKEFDEEKKAVSFPVRSQCPIDMKRYIVGLEKYERNESIALHDISDFLRFCKEPNSASKRLYFSLHGARLCAKLKCYSRGLLERVIPYNKDTISAEGSFFVENLYHIECDQCGERLDPIGWLISLKKRGLAVLFEYQQTMREKERLIAYIKEHNRCKCEHCGALTKIYKDGL